MPTGLTCKRAHANARFGALCLAAASTAVVTAIIPSAGTFVSWETIGSRQVVPVALALALGLADVVAARRTTALIPRTAALTAAFYAGLNAFDVVLSRALIDSWGGPVPVVAPLPAAAAAACLASIASTWSPGSIRRALWAVAIALLGAAVATYAVVRMHV